MPPLPKRKRSKSRQGTINAHRRKADLPGVVECPHCHQWMQPHRVCPQCGYYKGRNVLGIESEL